MNDIIFYTFLTKPTASQSKHLIDIYLEQGWWDEKTDSQNLLIEIIKGSHCFMVAQQNNRIIGMGRAISDRASDAYIQDVAVKIPYRSQGIGSRIVEQLVLRLKSDGMLWIGLIAEKNSFPFYEQLGFHQMPDAVPLIQLT